MHIKGFILIDLCIHPDNRQIRNRVKFHSRLDFLAWKYVLGSHKTVRRRKKSYRTLGFSAALNLPDEIRRNIE